MKSVFKILSILIGYVFLSFSLSAQIGIETMIVSETELETGDEVEVTLGIRNYNFSEAYDPASYPVFISVGLPASSEILEFREEPLSGEDADAFSGLSSDDVYNFVFDLSTPIPSTLEGGNVLYVTFKLLAVKPNPVGSSPQFLVQLQYPFGDMEGTDPDLQSVMSPVFNVIGEPLRVSLGDFTVTKTQNNEALLNWNTFSEEYSKGFVIERSKDGKNNWASLGFVASLSQDGTSVTELKYSFVDISPMPGENYYRLKQTELNGKTEYSKVRKLYIDAYTAGSISLYPNPARSLLYIRGAGVGQTLSIYDISGKLISDQKIESDNAPIDVAGLLQGAYMLELSTQGNRIWAGKFIKE
ncbi:MAG: T9SS type A sorting domain-containing protein [Taibaiella sp.]|nr:T9SS type A sorting domain-containing protein [Taibaiella sp.]